MIKVISVMKKKKKLMLKNINRKISSINSGFENGNTTPLIWSLDRTCKDHSWNAGLEPPVMLEAGVNFNGFRVVNSNIAGIRATGGDNEC